MEGVAHDILSSNWQLLSTCWVLEEIPRPTSWKSGQWFHIVRENKSEPHSEKTQKSGFKPRPPGSRAGLKGRTFPWAEAPPDTPWPQRHSPFHICPGSFIVRPRAAGVSSLRSVGYRGHVTCSIPLSPEGCRGQGSHLSRTSSGNCPRAVNVIISGPHFIYPKLESSAARDS